MNLRKILGILTTFGVIAATIGPALPVAAATQDWPLTLIGASTVTVTQAEFEALAAEHPSNTYTTTDGNQWKGVALWRFIAMVDDNDPTTFNDSLASVYSIKMTAADDYSKTVAPAEYAGNFTFINSEDVFLANKVMLNGTSEWIDLPMNMSAKMRYPLIDTGSGINVGNMRVGGLIKIELLNLPQPTTTVTIPSMSVASGASFSLPVNIDTDTASRGWQLDITFDASKLTLNSVTEGGFLYDYAVAQTPAGGTVSGGTPSIDNVNGTADIPGYAISGAGDSGPTGTGILCTLNFTAKADINDYALVTPLSTSVISDVRAATIPGVTWNAGTVAIGDAPMPDLVITAASATAVDEGNYTVTFTVKNQGNQDCVATTASVVIDGGDPLTFDIGALAAGASETVTTPNQALSGSSDTIVVTADSAGAVGESNETNNGKTITYAAVSAQGDMPISGNIESNIQITCPEGITDWALKQGANTYPQARSLNVKSNVNYGVMVYDFNDSNGHMTEFNATSGTFVMPPEGAQLDNELHVVAQENVALSNTPATLLTGTPAGQTGDAGQEFPVTFTQQVTYADPVLTNGNDYHIVLTFKASVTQ